MSLSVTPSLRRAARPITVTPSDSSPFCNSTVRRTRSRNVGVSGETSSSILGSQLSNALAAINDPGTDTTVVTIDIGGNDINCPTAPVTFSDCLPALRRFAQNFTTLLDAINGALANDPGQEQLIVMAYYNPWSGRVGEETTATAAVSPLGPDGKIDCAADEATLGLNDRIACVGAQHGAELADVYPPFVGKGTIDPDLTMNPPGWFADVVHPNDLGHAVIAAVFADVFTRDATVTCAGRTATKVGTGGDDVIAGTPGDDVIVAGDGDDVILGLGGNDVICAGTGNDQVYAGTGDDRVLGEDGNDLLRGGAGNDELFGQSGNDQLRGMAGNDALVGGDGNDALFGGIGNDALFGQNDPDAPRWPRRRRARRRRRRERLHRRRGHQHRGELLGGQAVQERAQSARVGRHGVGRAAAHRPGRAPWPPRRSARRRRARTRCRAACHR